MSAQQPQHLPVRLLIAEQSENAAHQFDSLLRDAGIATRLEIVDLPMAVDKIAQADLLLCNAALPQLAQLLPRLASIAPRVPIIVVNNDQGTLTQSEAMELGAVDAVSDSESRHLVLVVQRELEHVCQNVQYKQMRKSLNEAEQRCQLLLQSSRAAIAYVHEGMHIHANEGYLKLFGFEGADDLLGLSLIDLLDADSATDLKARLKEFRANEEETDLDFSGITTDGETVTGNMTLAAAEYEGEQCLQVTVRVADAVGPIASESDEGLADADVPILQEDAIVDGEEEEEVATAESVVAPVALANGAEAARSAETANGTDSTNFAAEVAAEGSAGEIDNTGSSFTLELLDNTANGNGEAANNQDSADPDTSADPTSSDELNVDMEQDPAAAIEFQTESAEPPVLEDETGSEDPDPAENTSPLAVTTTAEPSSTVAVDDSAATSGGISTFLSQSEALLKKQKGQFTSIFVAQIDNYDDLQRSHGLTGAETVCGKVEAQLLKNADGPFMQVSRYQWAMLVCDKTRDDALNKADGFRAAIESMMFEVREKTVRPTVTLGGAILNREGHDSADAALEATLDAALTTLRTTLQSSDGNTVELPAFDNAEQEYDDEANRVLSLIGEAIENQSFVLLFQPIISLRGDSDEHYEVFLRMHDRNGEQMAPGKFLSTAIDNGVAGKIDRWVILQSIKMLSTHRSKGHNTRLTINLTSNSVADPEFIQWLGVAIKAARLPSDAVIFQITEKDASLYIRQTREFVEGLKNLHCRASLSRFGLAAEPFEVLSHIPVDFVKLDGSLIADLNDDPDFKNDIAEMVRELQSAGKLTIVPMVESASVLSTLWQAGVNYIQGHYLQEPTSNMDYDFSTDD